MFQVTNEKQDYVYQLEKFISRHFNVCLITCLLNSFDQLINPKIIVVLTYEFYALLQLREVS